MSAASPAVSPGAVTAASPPQAVGFTSHIPEAIGTVIRAAVYFPVRFASVFAAKGIFDMVATGNPMALANMLSDIVTNSTQLVKDPVKFGSDFASHTRELLSMKTEEFAAAPGIEKIARYRAVSVAVGAPHLNPLVNYLRKIEGMAPPEKLLHEGKILSYAGSRPFYTVLGTVPALATWAAFTIATGGALTAGGALTFLGISAIADVMEDLFKVGSLNPFNRPKLSPAR